MRFILTCTLGSGVERTRIELRANHLRYVADRQSMIVFGGPSLGADGAPEVMTLVIEAPDLEAARRFSRDEPYTAHGVFSEVRIRRWAQVLPEPHPGALAEEIAKAGAAAP